MSLASLLADSGRVNEGWPYMEHAAAVAPDNALVHNNVATYLLRLRESNENCPGTLKGYQAKAYLKRSRMAQNLAS